MQRFPAERVVLTVVLVASVSAWGNDEKRKTVPVVAEPIAGFEPVAKNSQGFVEYRHKKTGIVMVQIPAGSFVMGSAKSKFADGDEQPPHRVELDAFLIAKHEVTQAEWERVMGSNPAAFSPSGIGQRRLKKGADTASFPVEMITWEDCERFCRATGLSFPTEAQWEYACRAGTKGHFSGNGKLTQMGWCRANSRRTQPVGTKSPNGFGLYDMHGNVAEWCADIYDRDFYKKPASRTKNPRADEPPAGGFVSRVVRGGGWLDKPARLRSSARSDLVPSKRSDHIGFRPVFVRAPNADS